MERAETVAGDGERAGVIGYVVAVESDAGEPFDEEGSAGLVGGGPYEWTDTDRERVQG